MDGHAEALVGEVWATAEAPRFALLRARPNPARSGTLNVEFVLEASGRVVLEVLDVSGRRILTRDVGGLGPGRHAVSLGAERRLVPGMYMVRLRQGGDERVLRAAMLD